jgi:hypothetical protein
MCLSTGVNLLGYDLRQLGVVTGPTADGSCASVRAIASVLRFSGECG